MTPKKRNTSRLLLSAITLVSFLVTDVRLSHAEQEEQEEQKARPGLSKAIDKTGQPAKQAKFEESTEDKSEKPSLDLHVGELTTSQVVYDLEKVVREGDEQAARELFVPDTWGNELAFETQVTGKDFFEQNKASELTLSVKQSKITIEGRAIIHVRATAGQTADELSFAVVKIQGHWKILGIGRDDSAVAELLSSWEPQ